MDKHSSLSRIFVNYGRRKFYDIGPRKELIEKYLQPEPLKTKEVLEKQKKTAEDLKTLRNQMVS